LHTVALLLLSYELFPLFVKALGEGLQDITKKKKAKQALKMQNNKQSRHGKPIQGIKQKI